LTTYHLSLHDALPIYAARSQMSVRSFDEITVEMSRLAVFVFFINLIENNISLTVRQQDIRDRRATPHYRYDHRMTMPIDWNFLRSEEHTSELQSRFDL